MDYQYEQEKARTQQDGRNNTEAQYLITDYDTWIPNPFWDGVTIMDLSEPEQDPDFAFTAVTIVNTDEWTYTIGIAHKDQPGFSRPVEFPAFETYDDAQKHADLLNKDIGLTTLEAWKIVASTMKK